MPQSAAVRAAHEDDLPLLRREGNPRSHDFNSATLGVSRVKPSWTVRSLNSLLFSALRRWQPRSPSGVPGAAIRAFVTIASLTALNGATRRAGSKVAAVSGQPCSRWTDRSTRPRGRCLIAVIAVMAVRVCSRSWGGLAAAPLWLGGG
jgi:hypothetical protein